MADPDRSVTDWAAAEIVRLRDALHEITEEYEWIATRTPDAVRRHLPIIHAREALPCTIPRDTDGP